MLRVRHRRARPLVNRRQPHPGHQPSDPLTTDLVPIPPQVPRHLARAIPRRLQELRVDQAHQSQDLCRLARRLVVER